MRLDYAANSFAALDRFGRVLDQVWTDYGVDPDVVLDEYTYTYDRAGNRTSRDNELHSAFDEDYLYDGLDRLTDADRADAFDQSWGLDGLGNFSTFDDDGTSQTRTTNAVNEITGISGAWIDPSYDDAGNMIAGPKTGEETTRLHHVYDAWNRQTAVYEDDGDATFEPGTDDDLVAAYEYDGANRRIEKTFADDSGVEYFYNHDWQMLAERAVDDEGTPTGINQYVWSARYIDAPVLRFHDANADGDLLDAGDNTRYYTGDANYNVTATIDAATGEVVERYVYSAYGTATVYDENWANSAAATSDGPLYCGYFFDAESAMCQVRNRYYDSGISTFINRDPIRYWANDANLYRYLANRPTGLLDPSGTIDLGGGGEPPGWCGKPKCMPGDEPPGDTWLPNPNAPPPPPSPEPPLLPPSLVFLWDFLTGGGDDVRCYCNGEVPLEEMKKSPGAEKLRRAFYRNCGRDTWNVGYGTGEAFVGTIVGGTFFFDTGDQVGGFGGASATVNPDGTVTFTISNTAGTHSFFYHICPDRPPGSKYMRTIQQTFQWTEKIDPQRCILTPRSNTDPMERARVEAF